MGNKKWQQNMTTVCSGFCFNIISNQGKIKTSTTQCAGHYTIRPAHLVSLLLSFTFLISSIYLLVDTVNLTHRWLFVNNIFSYGWRGG
ncbi:MAG TPA: hypothetical protein DD791_01065 [Syntrophomonas sp.]|nr:hypothetical protein [Syntrophomonas sp.]